MDITITKRFAHQFKQISQLLNIKPVALNKSAAKPYSHWPKKGVESDHVKIFQLTPEMSIAFSFKGLVWENTEITASLKHGDYFELAKYRAEAFRKKLNDFVRLLKITKTAKPMTPAVIGSTFVANFIQGNEYNSTQTVDNVVAKIKTEISAANKKHFRTLTKRKELEELIETKKQVLDEKVHAAEKREKVAELRSSLNKALENVKKEKDQVSEIEQIMNDQMKLISKVEQKQVQKLLAPTLIKLKGNRD